MKSKRMKKAVVLFLAALAVSSAMTGCTPPGKTQDNKKPSISLPQNPAGQSGNSKENANKILDKILGNQNPGKMPGGKKNPPKPAG